MLQSAYRLQAGDDPSEGGGDVPVGFEELPPEGEDLPYKVEVWDVSAEFVEHVVAVSAHPAIGFAAYYAAAREFPGRDITLRFQNQILSRWTRRSH